MDSKVQTWFELANGDLEFASEILAAKKRPHYAAHFCHQAIEKLLKAIIQKKTDTTPIPTHNFKMLCKQANIEILEKQYTQRFSEALYKETKEFFKWLESTYLK